MLTLWTPAALYDPPLHSEKMSEPCLSHCIRSRDPAGRWGKTTTSRMHCDSAGHGAVHSGSSTLRGTRGNAFLNVMLETEASRSRRSFPRLTVNLWVERGPAFVSRARKAIDAAQAPLRDPKRKPSLGQCGHGRVAGPQVGTDGPNFHFPGPEP